MGSLVAQSPILTATCKCGSVQYSLTATPIYSAYCHCPACGNLNLNSHNCSHVYINWTDQFLLHQPTDIQELDAVKPFPAVTQYSCRSCQQPVYSSIPGEDWILTYGVNLNNTKYNVDLSKPRSHIFYKFAKQPNLAVLDVSLDTTIPIYSDLPGVLNGSNEQMNVHRNVIVNGTKTYKPGDAKLSRNMNVQ